MNIFLAEADPNIRYGLRTLCEQVDGVAIIREATNTTELLEALKHTCPDALLISELLPGLSTSELELALLQMYPALIIFFLKVSVSRDNHHLASDSCSRMIPVHKPEQLLGLLVKFSKQKS